MGINRNIVECKYQKTAGCCTQVQVLIETLWNVNWEKVIAYPVDWRRINRNIVECK